MASTVVFIIVTNYKLIMIASAENYNWIVGLKKHKFPIPTPGDVPPLCQSFGGQDFCQAQEWALTMGYAIPLISFFAIWAPSLADSLVIWKEKWSFVLLWSVIKGTWSITKEGKKWLQQSCHSGIIEPLRLEKPVRTIKSNCKPNSTKATVKLCPQVPSWCTWNREMG